MRPLGLRGDGAIVGTLAGKAACEKKGRIEEPLNFSILGI
jgi:hypothetical protein